MKIFKRNKILASALALSVVLGTSSSFAQALRCETIFAGTQGHVVAAKTIQDISYEKLLELDANGYTFAKGVKGEGKEMQFGFESEYGLSEIAPFTNYYGPTAEAGIGKKAWLEMSVENRMKWVEGKLKSIPFGSKDPVLVLLEKTPELSFLPSELIRDDTGNVEIILAPVSKFETWKNQMQWINRNFGVGSMQSMISQPRETFFARGTESKELALKENEGYFNFLHDADVLSRMAQGAEKFAKDPTKEVMRPFLHPYLGPMIKLRQKKMTHIMEEVASGKVLSQEELAAVIKLEHSSKYIGSTSYRPDIGGPTRMAQEVRDTHKDEALLIDRTARAIVFAQKGRAAFLPMANLKALDSKVQFDAMPENIQTLLRTVLPNRPPKKFEHESAKLVHETFRNFSYPMRNWRPVLQALDRMDLHGTVKTAREGYLAKLQAIDSAFSAGKMTKEEANAQVQGALANFAVDSKLHEAFRKFEAEIPGKVREMPYNLLSARRSFALRMENFMQQWPQNTSVVDSVGFKYRDGIQKTSSDRNVLVISTEGLSSAQITKMESDYLNLVSIQTVSFPLKERATHTLVQFNGTVYNFGYAPIQAFPRFRIGEYKASSSRRIEAVALLSRLEENNFNTYISNIKADKKAVLGKFMLEGDPRTNGTLKDNRSVCGNNCTTWIATAPIGKDGESLASLLGGEQSVPWIKQNPGWMNSWLLGTASQARIPLVVYWTNKSVKDALATELKDNTIEWDFNRK